MDAAKNTRSAFFISARRSDSRLSPVLHDVLLFVHDQPRDVFKRGRLGTSVESGIASASYMLGGAVFGVLFLRLDNGLKRFAMPFYLAIPALAFVLLNDAGHVTVVYFGGLLLGIAICLYNRRSDGGVRVLCPGRGGCSTRGGHRVDERGAVYLAGHAQYPLAPVRQRFRAHKVFNRVLRVFRRRAGGAHIRAFPAEP